MLDFKNDFKWQADDSDHHRVRVEGKFRRPVGPRSLSVPRGGVAPIVVPETGKYADKDTETSSRRVSSLHNTDYEGLSNVFQR